LVSAFTICITILSRSSSTKYCLFIGHRLTCF
jgi:hypothetical protein